MSRARRSGEGGPRDIAWLVHWALVEQGGLNALMGGDEGPGLGWMDLGVRIDTSSWSKMPPIGRGQTGGVAHADAEAVLEAIRQLPDEAAGLVVHYGRIGWGSEARPDWCPEGPGEFVQQRDGRGRPRWMWEHPASRSGKKLPMMVFTGTRPEIVSLHRAEYECWWLGLRALQRHLAQPGRMSTWQPSGPSAPREPWRDGSRPSLLPGTAMAANGRA